MPTIYADNTADVHYIPTNGYYPSSSQSLAQYSIPGKAWLEHIHIDHSRLEPPLREDAEFILKISNLLITLLQVFKVSAIVME